MQAPKKRGRPATGNAMSSTERSRILRSKALDARQSGATLTEYADSVLLLAFESAYRAKQAGAVERLAGELLGRIGVDATESEAVDTGELQRASAEIQRLKRVISDQHAQAVRANQRLAVLEASAQERQAARDADAARKRREKRIAAEDARIAEATR